MIHAYYRDQTVKNNSGIECDWSAFEAYCLSVGAFYFAKCMEDISKLNGWRLLVAGGDPMDVQSCAKDRYKKHTGLWLGDWDLKRFDGELFNITDWSGPRPRDIPTHVLTFR